MLFRYTLSSDTTKLECYGNITEKQILISAWNDGQVNRIKDLALKIVVLNNFVDAD